MKIFKRIFLVASLLYTFPLFAQLSVVNVPTGAAVVLIQPSAVFISWNARSGAANPSTVISEEGLFVLDNQVLGRVGTPLTGSIAPNGNASLTETLLVPPDIANRVFHQNANTFFYRRIFRSTADGSTATAALTCRVSTSAFGNFSIASVTLFFDNERGQATFQQNDLKAHAFAEIHYNGSGLIKAAWEVQEPSTLSFRILQQVNYHLSFGDRILFRSPDLPPLPTLLAGVHQLRFRILEPVSGFEYPIVSYFVTPAPGETKEKADSKLSLIVPADLGTMIKGSSFQWEGEIEGSKIIKISVYEKSSVSLTTPANFSYDEKSTSGTVNLNTSDLTLVRGVEVFSAVLASSTRSYIPKDTQWKRLLPGTKYLWQVAALDVEGKVIGESNLRVFQAKQ